MIQHSFQALSFILSSLTLISFNYPSATLDVTFVPGFFQLFAFLPSFASLLPLRGHPLNLHSGHHDFCRPIFVMEILHFAPSEMTGESTVFTLSTSSDLKILVTEWFEGYVSESSDKSSDSEVSEDHPARFNSPRAPITEKAIFYVKRSVLAENNVWLAKEQDDTINLRTDEPYGIKGLCVWLAAFHGQSTPFSTMSIDDIWGAIKVGNINDFDRRKLQPWFEGWVARIRDEQPVKWNDVLFNRQLLFPCHFFDDAEGFKHLT